MYKQDSASEQPKNIYTIKELVMKETTISNFHTSLYIQEIWKLSFHLPHVKILGINKCGYSRWTAFKCCKSFQDVICRRGYAERVVASFDHEIQ